MLMERGIVAALVGMAALATTGEAAPVSARAKAEFSSAMGKAVREEKAAQHEKERKNRLRRSLLAKAVPADQRRLADNNNDDAEENNYEPFNFDASLYSIKYSGCHRMPQYPDDEAEQQNDNDNGEVGSFYTYKNLVTFRLCESESCSNGCKNDYGEYMISLEDYMEAMIEYKEHVLEYYCDYCEKCMYFENYFYGHRNLEDADNAGDDAAEDDGGEWDEAEEEEYLEYYATDDDSDNHACKYYNECVDYANVCGDDQNDDGDDDYYQDVELQELFECRAIDNYYYHGSYAYAGLYCADDHKTISIGVFSDQYCSQYIGDDVDYVQATRMNITEEEMSFFSDDSCIPCNDNEQPYKVADMEEGEDGEDGENMLELCERIYESSAKCQMNLADEYGKYGNLVTSSQESTVCEYIESVETQQYDENGFLYMNKLTYDRDVFKYLPVMSECTVLQQVGLVMSFVACLVMSVHACCLKCSLARTMKDQPSLLPNDKGEFNHGSATTEGEQNEEYRELKQSESQKLAKDTIAGTPVPGGVISLKRFDSLDNKYREALKKIGELEKTSRNYINEIANSFDSKISKNGTASVDSKKGETPAGEKAENKSPSVLEMFLEKIDPTYKEEKEAAKNAAGAQQKPPLPPKKKSSKDAKRPPLPPTKSSKEIV